MRRHAAALAAVGGLVALAGPAAAQRPRFEVGAGVALVTPLLRDGNGTEVRLAAQPVLGARLASGATTWGPVRAVATGRVGRSTLRLRAPGARWSAGAAWQADFLGGGALAAAPWLALRASAGLTWLSGDVAPLGGSAGVRPVAEFGATLARPGGRVGIEVAAQAIRIVPDGGDAGGVGRYLVGVTYAP